MERGCVWVADWKNTLRRSTERKREREVEDLGGKKEEKNNDGQWHWRSELKVNRATMDELLVAIPEAFEERSDECY